MNQRVTSYRLNTDAARQVGQASGIDEKGAYIGQFTRAELVVSTKGTQGIEFDFITLDGRTARYLSVWTVNKDGQELGGRKLIDAIMTSIGVREIQAADATIKKWNTETRSEENTRATVFPALMGKPIGLVLCREEYMAGDGQLKWKNVMVCPFEAVTKRTASERLDNAPAEMLDKIVASLRDRPYREAPRTTGTGHRTNASQSSGGSGFDDMDDNIPF